MDHLKSKIRHVPDFPKAGILFYDITTLLQEPAGFRAAIDSLALPFEDQGIEVVVGIESRGFIFGAAVADRIGAGFSPVRKPGKLPSTTHARDLRRSSTAPTRSRCTRMRSRQGQRVLIVDDLLATGGTARATIDLVTGLGGDGARARVPHRARRAQRARAPRRARRPHRSQVLHRPDGRCR